MEIASPDFQAAQLDLLSTSLDANLIVSGRIGCSKLGREGFSQRARWELLNRADQLVLKQIA